MAVADQWVDVSSHNPTPDIAKYKAAGHRFIMVKASEGTGYHFAQGDEIADIAHSNGLSVGRYHWLRPDFDPFAQADFFVSVVRPHWLVGDRLMADLETTYDLHGNPIPDPPDSARASQLAKFNSRVSTLLARPMVYTGNWYLAGKPACQAECRRWDVVMSDYTHRPPPNPYGLNYVAQQFTDKATVAGISGLVDYNTWLPGHGLDTGGGTPLEDDVTVDELRAELMTTVFNHDDGLIEIRQAISALGNQINPQLDALAQHVAAAQLHATAADAQTLGLAATLGSLTTGGQITAAMITEAVVAAGPNFAKDVLDALKATL